jgi:hypothetical protein
MIALPSPASTKIAKLLPMLASDKDGEVVATVHAIGRTLKNAGSDWHALAAVLTNSAPAPEPEPQSWHEMALWCQRNDFGRLTLHERDFINNMCGWRRPMTARQQNLLHDIHTKLRRARA